MKQIFLQCACDKLIPSGQALPDPRVFGNESGFTMLEMIAVIMMIAILCAMGAPSMKNLSDSFTRNGVRVQIMQDLRRAQATSVTEGCHGIFTVSSDNKSYSYGCDYVPYSAAIPPSPDSTTYTKTMPNGFEITADARVIFNSKGQVMDSYGILDTRIITLKNKGATFETGTLRANGFFAYD